jgi:AraC family transcriptional regulator
MAIHFLREFPNVDRFETLDRERRFYRAFWHENLIIHATAREVAYAPHISPLTIKCTFAGRETYELGREGLVVDETSYLVLNRAQPHSSHIESKTPVESFAIFFRAGFIEDALAGLIVSTDRLLDQPDQPHPTFSFFDRLYPRTDRVGALLGKFRELSRSPQNVDPLCADQLLLRLAEALLEAHRGALREAERLEALRPATRAELYRRLCRARDLIDSMPAEPLDADRLARAACLSSAHFLRQFARAFGRTPHRYLVERRVELARRLLREGDLPAAAVAERVGFQDASAFGRAFRAASGMSPLAYRRAQK